MPFLQKLSRHLEVSQQKMEREPLFVSPQKSWLQRLLPSLLFFFSHCFLLPSVKRSLHLWQRRLGLLPVFVRSAIDRSFRIWPVPLMESLLRWRDFTNRQPAGRLPFPYIHFYCTLRGCGRAEDCRPGTHLSGLVGNVAAKRLSKDRRSCSFRPSFHFHLFGGLGSSPCSGSHCVAASSLVAFALPGLSEGPTELALVMPGRRH